MFKYKGCHSGSMVVLACQCSGPSSIPSTSWITCPYVCNIRLSNVKTNCSYEQMSTHIMLLHSCFNRIFTQITPFYNSSVYVFVLKKCVVTLSTKYLLLLMAAVILQITFYLSV